jgi:gliding motility-associated-like protein
MYCLDSSSQTLALNHPLSANFTMAPSDTVCQLSPTFFVSAVTSDVLPTYLWQFGDGGTATSPDPSHTFVNEGVYSVTLTVTNSIPCSASVTKIITVDSLNILKLNVTDTVLCQGTFATFTSLYSYLGAEGLSWYMGDGSDSLKNRNPVTYSYNYPDSFIVTAMATFRACPASYASRKIWVLPQPQLDLGPDTTICPGGNAILLSDQINNNNPTAVWRWSTGQTSSAIFVGQPGVYTATVGLSGCYTTDSVVVSSDCYMNIPNIFTPNGDGINDYFYPRQLLSKGLTYFKINIFNRWGELIFESTATDGRGWDGRFNGVDQPEGVYIYIIDAGFKDGQMEHHQGNVTLMR